MYTITYYMTLAAWALLDELGAPSAVRLQLVQHPVLLDE